MLFSVADLLGGPNTETQPILSNAVGSLLGMAEYRQRMEIPEGRLIIATTASGNSNEAVTRARDILDNKGYEVIAFHASGAGGSAMEDLITQGIIKGMLDLTMHELIGEIFDDDVYAPVKPVRLETTGKMGIPEVVAPGALNYFCSGGVDTIPEKYKDWAIHYNNRYNTNIRTSREEAKKISKVFAEKLNQSQGDTVMMIPLKGWSENGRKGGQLCDPELD